MNRTRVENLPMEKETIRTCRSLTLQEIKEILDCEVITGEEKMDMILETACGADLMSDVLAFARPHCLLLTGLTNPQVIRTAEVADIKAIVFVRGKRPDQQTILLAKEKEIPLLTTRYLMYESCGRLYQAGLPGESELKRKT